MQKKNVTVLSIQFFLLVACAHKNKNLACSDFKNGLYFSKAKQNVPNIIYISRTDTLQIERNNEGKERKALIKWINDCEYELKYFQDSNSIQVSQKDSNDFITVITKIVKTESGEAGETQYYYCVTESSLRGSNKKTVDTLFKSGIDP